MLRTAFGFMAIGAFLSACSPESPSWSQAGKTASDPDSAAVVPVQLSRRPEITTERILKDVVGKQITVGDVAAESRSLDWTFEANEPKNAEILERYATDTSISLVIQMTTGSAPDSDEEQVQLSGKLALLYEWNGREWSLRRIENLTFRYSRRLST